MKDVIARILLVLGVLAAPALARAEDFPPKSMSIVVPFSPGGPNDVIARYLANHLGEMWKMTVVVENRPGAGSAIGIAAVAKAKPNGATLLFVSSSITTLPATRANLPFDTQKDLQPVAMIGTGQMVIVTGKRLPATSLAEIVAAGKTRPLFYGTAGIGSTTHFSAALLTEVAGIQTEAVHYKGGTEALLDLIGGHIDLYVGTSAAVGSMVASKMITAVAIASPSRLSTMPDVPTVKEAGLPGAESEVWWGIFGPAGTPADIVEKTNAAINAVMDTPASREFMQSQGASPSTMSVAGFSNYVGLEMTRWKELAARHNITAH